MNKVSERRVCRVLGQNRGTRASPSTEDRRRLRTLGSDAEARRRVPEARERANASCTDWPGGVRWLEGELQAGAQDLEGGAHAGASQAAETPEISGRECQRLLKAQGDASQPRLELSPLTERTEDGRQLRILVVIDEFTRECLAIEVARSFTARDVIMTRQYLFAVCGAPEHLRSDDGPELVAKEIQEWLGRACVRTRYIQKASPWENGYVESFSCLAPLRAARGRNCS